MSETVEEGTIMVRRSGYGRPATEREVKVPVPDFGDTPTARIAVGMSSTRRMSDDMEFMKVEIRVELPCLPNDTDIRETQAYAIDLIRTALAGEEPAPPPVHVTPRHIPGTPIA